MALRPAMVAVLAAASLGSATAAQAATWFVTGEGGRAPADAAGGSVVPSLQALSDRTLAGGDRVLLHCAGTHEGGARLRLAGGGDAVRIGRYGDCAAGRRPLISGKSAVALRAGGPNGLAVARVDKPVTQVFFDDAMRLPARWPKDGYELLPRGAKDVRDVLPGMQALSSRAGATAAAESAAADRGPRLRGARAIVRSHEWYIEERQLSDDHGALDKALEWPARGGSGYYLIGKAWMIDRSGREGGWAWDAADSTLAVRNPRSQRIEVSFDEALLRIEGKGSVEIADLNFDAAGADALWVHLDGRVRIERIDVTRSANNAISVAGAAEAVIDGVRIEGAGRDGVFFAEVKRAAVRNSIVADAGTWLGPRPALAAINAHRTDTSVIEDNEVLRSGYIGIRACADSVIRRNRIVDACRTISDCAGIYTWRRNANDHRPANEIAGNLVLGVRGDTSVKLGVNDYFAGIYLDDYTRSTTVRNNVVVGAAQGIYVHNAVDNVVRDNVVIGSRHKSLLVGIDVPKFPPGADLGNRIEDNTLLEGRFDWRLRRAPAAARAPWVLELREAGAAAAGGECRSLAYGDQEPKDPGAAMVDVLDCRRDR